LKYFYRRLVRNGVIFVHDYENPDYKGAGQAVRDFSRRYKVPYFIMSDMCGSAVILK
jgi:O-methyltransferase